MVCLLYTSPLVGDAIRFTPGAEEEHGWVEDILPRKTQCIRPPVANVELMLIVAAPVPAPDLLLVDRLLVRARQQGMEAALVVNKCDLDGALAGELARQYARAEAPVYPVSARTGQGLDALRQAMTGRLCCFAGLSGVGKSTLLNALTGLGVDVYKRQVWQWEKGLAPDAYIVHGAADIARDADFQAGRFSIQSQSSMFAALAIQTRPGMQALDVCAAPGGKTCYLAERLNGTGRVQSWDLHPHRVKLIEAQARRLRLDNVRPMARDATILREDLAGTMDAVLLDAPCSGTGVMAGKPDVKYRVTPQDVEALTKTQQALLETCCRYVRPGGQLVYSTCSILPEENALQLRRFLDGHPEFALLPLPESFPDALRQRYGENGLQLLPHRDHLDGFFIARMGRKP